MVDVTAVKVRKAGAWVTVWPTGPLVSISNQTLYELGNGDVYTEYWIDSLGAVSKNSGDTVSGADPTFGLETWLLSGASSDYDVRFTLLSGTPGTGSAATGVWLNLGTTRSMRAEAGTGSSSTVSVTVEIRQVSTGTILDTATVDITAESSL